MFRVLFALACFCMLLHVNDASAATIVVPDQYYSIQDAIYASGDGDTVYIRAGVYYETSISIGKVPAGSPSICILVSSRPARQFIETFFPCRYFMCLWDL